MYKERRASKSQRWVLYILLGRPLMVTLTNVVPIFSSNIHGIITKPSNFLMILGVLKGNVEKKPVKQ